MTDVEMSTTGTAARNWLWPVRAGRLPFATICPADYDWPKTDIRPLSYIVGSWLG